MSPHVLTHKKNPNVKENSALKNSIVTLIEINWKYI